MKNENYFFYSVSIEMLLILFVTFLSFRVGLSSNDTNESFISEEIDSINPNVFDNRTELDENELFISNSESIQKINKSDDNENIKNQKTMLKKEQIKSFKLWKLKNNRTDIADDDLEATKNFLRNDEEIRRFNKQNNSTYLKGHNKYSDMSLKAITNKGGLVLPDDVKIKTKHKLPKAIILPKIVNHRKRMGPVKDQKDCGACYAFAATGLIEYLYRIRKKRVILSEQEIVDCDVFAYGCVGV